MSRARSTAADRHPKSLLSIDVSRLGRRPGSMIHRTETVPSPMRIGLDLVAIPKGAPLDLDLRL